MVTLEAVEAAFGDCLLLHWQAEGRPRLAVIDGGPKTTFEQRLRPRLDQVRSELAPLVNADGQLEVELMMVSHIDDDHIVGLLKMMRALSAAPETYRIKRFWHNAFDDIVPRPAGAPASAASVQGLDGPGELASFAASGADPRMKAIVSSVNQGRELRDLLRRLKLSGNKPFDKSLITAPVASDDVPGLKLTVVGPLQARLDKLQKAWEKAKLPKQKQAILQGFTDTSPHNLSSIVVLVECEGRKILLTGDARGDDILAGLEAAKLIAKNGTLPLDVLKVPHHGSDRNVETDFFRRLPAKHYVISADGTHDNPSKATIDMIEAARGTASYTIHMTNRVASVSRRLAALAKKRGVNVIFRNPKKHAIAVSI